MTFPDARTNEMNVPEATFHLTGRTGSLFYMAPEMTFAQPYNEKVSTCVGHYVQG